MTTSEVAPTGLGARIAEIDVLRGLVIVIMALDHTRDYFHADAFLANPLDPTTTTPLLYATRWITHLCAPTFVLLAGVSAYLQLAKGKTGGDLSAFLFTRGLWLIVLEATIISFGWSFGFPLLLFLQVIWAIGWAMLALAALVWLPRWLVLAIGVAIVAGHNLLDPIAPDQLGAFNWLWMFLHDGGVLPNFEAPAAYLAYPVLPWIGVIACGYGLGSVFLQAPAKRDRTLCLLGLALLAVFVLLRWFDLYGDASVPAGFEAAVRSWRDQEGAQAQVMVFLDVEKYPPSLQFLLVTLGLVFAFWPALSRLRGPVASVLNTFGAVPFFFYVLHIYLIHALSIAANAAAGHNVQGYLNYLYSTFTAWRLFEGTGFSLPWVYVAWIVVLALLYPVCRWWQQVKARDRKWWMSYL